MSSVDETSVKFTWNASKACDAMQYSLNGGGWIGGDWPQTNITGLSANTQYSVKIRAKATDSQLWTESSVKYVTTYNYPYCTSAPDFKIGSNVKLDFYNPLNRTIKIQMWSYTSQGFVSDQITINGTTYTGFSNVKDRLYESIPNKTESQYTIDVWYGDIKSTKWDGGKYSTNGNENPVFSNFTYEDTNVTTKALTGNNQILVNGYSNLKVTISTANKAYSNYASPINKYRLNVGNMSSVEAAFSNTNQVDISINSINSPSITVTAIDGRNYTAQVSKTATFKGYFKPIIKSMITERGDGGVGSQVTLQFSGEWWNDNFGEADNTIKTIEYYYKKTTDTTWTKGNVAIIPTISDNEFSGSILIEGPNADDKGFDVSTSYNIKMSVTDALATSTEYQAILGSGTPGIALCNNKVAIGQKYDEELGGTLQVDGYDVSNKFKQYLPLIGGTLTGDLEVKGKLTPTDGIYVNNQKLMDFNASGKGMAIGKVSEKDAFEVDLPTEINKDSTFNGYVIENKKDFSIPTNIGTTNGWYLALSGEMTGYQNRGFMLAIEQTYSGGSGILYVNLRCDNTNYLSIKKFEWLTYNGIDSSNLKLKTEGNNFYLYLKTTEDYQQYHIRIIEEKVLSGINYGLFTINKPTYIDTISEPTGINPTDKVKKIKTLSSIGDVGWSNQTDGDAYLVTKAFMAWWNGAYSGTSSNLTYCSDGTIQAKPVIGYSNLSGTTGTVALSVDVSNYNHIRITYENSDGQYGSTTISGVDSANCTTYGTIVRKNGDNSAILINSALFTVSGNTITISRNSQANMWFGDNDNASDNNALYITKVELWN